MNARSFLTGAVFSAIALVGCVATRYEKSPQQTPPPVLLNLAAAQPPIALSLRSVIVYDGPGSWKREALWDEYVVTIHNQGAQALTVSSAALIDFSGARHGAGDDPWKLEKDSQTLEERYERDGFAMARSATPHVLVIGAGAAAGAAGNAMLSAAAATAATASLVALPIYYIVTFSVNHSNKADVVAEFTRRRLVLPLTMEAFELRTGSVFFPMTPRDPQQEHIPQRKPGQEKAIAVDPGQQAQVAHPPQQAQHPQEPPRQAQQAQHPQEPARPEQHAQREPEAPKEPQHQAEAQHRQEPRVAQSGESGPNSR
jgi:hypothetical protein